MAHSASEVAKWFLTYNKMVDADGDAENISNMKLQKLLYYAQGAFLAVTKAPIFPEEIQAWKHGPVVPEVYHEYKAWGSHGIEFNEDFNRNAFSSQEDALLQEVYNEFGQYSAWKLREMTHQESPWKETPQGSIISQEKIQKFFEENYIE